LKLIVYSVGFLVTLFSVWLLYSIHDSDAFAAPVLKDSNFKLDMIKNGFSRPTGISFLGSNDFLVIEENTGKVKRVVNGQSPQIVLDVNVATTDSRGLLGIDSVVAGNSTFVFLYFTESSSCDGGNAIGNRLYKYQLVNNQLVNPKLLLDLPSNPGTRDNGGPVLIGPDNNVYATTGHISDTSDIGHQTKAQNFEKGPDADGTSGIHRVTQDGNIVGTPILGSSPPLDSYYAYGIRNVFGMDFDPVTGKLWISENGVHTNDEINLVEPGFNSGWADLTGFAPSGFNFNGLVTFDGKGIYSDPEFVWQSTVAPTALLFLNTDKLGPDYKNDIFVGDYKFGRIYHFDLNPERNALLLGGPLSDKIANSDSELQGNVFAEGFGIVTDLEIGPDGQLYVTSLNDGTVYRISSSNSDTASPTVLSTIPSTGATNVAASSNVG
jgi:aldose sugar dehydrogenase